MFRLKHNVFSLLAIICSLTSLMASAQQRIVTMEMINMTLPLEGAPLAASGPYEVVVEAAFDTPGYMVFRPVNLSSFPNRDTLPVLIWGNGGCALNGARATGLMQTIASHGFLVLSTMPLENDQRGRQSMEILSAGIDWAERENRREGSELQAKIAIDKVAAMGQSCGGAVSIGLGADPRVSTIGVLNTGVAPAGEGINQLNPNTNFLAELNGPVLFINGGGRDFQQAASRMNYDLINHVSTFYGSRFNAGHMATTDHAGGGEFANVASSWLLYHFKGDQTAGEMFLGDDCSLCTDPNWITDSKGFD